MKQINCTQYIALACSAINASLESVKALFHEREQCEIYYSNKEKKDFQLEIRFDMATLTCLFDENNICESAFLFLDDLMDITHYIEYCNKTFPCNMIRVGSSRKSGC